MIEFKTKTFDTLTLIEFSIVDNICLPEEIKDIVLPKVDYTRGIIISGRGPVWLYGAIIHHCHPAAWVATFDPRLGGGVVVASHVKGIRVGDIKIFKSQDLSANVFK